MAQIAYRINLSAKSFPLIGKYWGQTIIVPQYDNNFNRNLTSDADADKDIGIPQAYYLHNVMPTAEGFRSVGYSPVAPAPLPGRVFSNLYDISGISNQTVWLGATDDTAHTYVYEYNKWIAKPYTVDVSKKITVATISGRTFVCAASQGIWEYGLDTRAFASVTFTGLTVGLIDGVCPSFGYTIVWTKQVDASTPIVSTYSTTTLDNFSPSVTDLGLVPGIIVTGANIPIATTVVSVNAAANSIVISNAATSSILNTTVHFSQVPSQVLWSSTIDPTDFVPSLVTGAGGGAVEEAKGAIIACIPHNLGFFVFTTKNIVVALYTANARYPFTFREIVNSGGIDSIDRISYDANTGNLYVYNTSGFQIISTSQAQTIFPEVTGFLAGPILEDYNEVTNALEYFDTAGNMQVNLRLVADRYLIISYGLSSFTHALVYDISQKRFGKLKFAHVKCFEFIASGTIKAGSPQKSVCFLTANGEVFNLEFDHRSSISNGVILLGKYQFVRTRLLHMDEVRLENIEEDAVTTVGIFPALDGKNFGDLDTGYLNGNVGGLRTYLFDAVGINHTVLVKGGFNLTSGELVFHIDGKS